MNKMKSSDIKEIMIRSLDEDSDLSDVSLKLEQRGAGFDFRDDFEDNVMSEIISSGNRIIPENEFSKSLNRAFYRILITGAAAIIIMMISIFIMEGSFSFDSFLGLGNSYDESTIYLLTGN